MKTMVILGLLGLLCAGCGNAVETSAKPPEINAAKWINADSNGVTLAGLTGKVVVVEFWSTTCHFCKKAAPDMNRIHQENKDKGVVFIGLTTEDSTKAKVEKHVADLKKAYIIGTGSTSAKAYGVKGVPAVVVIGKDGKVLWSGHPSDGLEKVVAEALVLGDKPGRAPAPPPAPAKKSSGGT